MPKEKTYSVVVNTTFSGRIEIAAESMVEAKKKTQEFFDTQDFCNIRHNLKELTQVNVVPVSYISLKRN